MFRNRYENCYITDCCINFKVLKNTNRLLINFMYVVVGFSASILKMKPTQIFKSHKKKTKPEEY